MSATAALPDYSMPVPPRKIRGGHLSLVSPKTSAAQRPRCGASGSARLTRRGRLTITTTLLVALAGALVMTFLLGVSAEADAAVTVQPGQTLSELAAVTLPHLPLDVAMVQIQRANGLSSSQLQVGQILTVPGP